MVFWARIFRLSEYTSSTSAQQGYSLGIEYMD